MFTTFDCQSMDKQQDRTINYVHSAPDCMRHLTEAIKQLQTLKELEKEMSNIKDMDVITTWSMTALHTAISDVDTILNHIVRKGRNGNEFYSYFHDTVISILIGGLSSLTRDENRTKAHSKAVTIMVKSLEVCSFIKLKLDEYINCEN